MDYKRLNNERITNTKIAPYDVITVVTQRAINKQLEMMHHVNESLRKFSLLSADPEDNYSRLEVEFTAPKIELQLNAEDRNVIFCLNITRAQLKYLKPGPNGGGRGALLEESLDIPASTLALHVNLALEDVDFSRLPQHVQDRLNRRNNYGVRQLVVDLAGASLARLDKGRTTVHDHIKHLPARDDFNSFMERYFGVLARENEFVLHCILLANEDSRQTYEIPTFRPTNFTFQNMPFIQNDQDNGSPSEDNMLLYLQMCGHDMPNELLPVSTNWVVPTPNHADRYDGTVALSADTFLNGWLLKKLSDFNRSSTWTVRGGGWLHGEGFHFYGKLGLEDASDSDVMWRARDYTNVDQNVRNKVNGQIGQWYHYYSMSGKDYHNRVPGWADWMLGKTTNWLFIPEGYNNNGKCEILVYGNTFIEFSVFSARDKGAVNGEWSTRIVLDGGNDGELTVKADDINLKITKTGASDLQVTKHAEEGLKNLNMTSIVDEMNNLAIILPGADDFYISKAVFNREKDLMCELKRKVNA